MERLLTLQYYFTPAPDHNYHYTIATFAVAAFLILSGFALAYFRRKKVNDEVLKKMLRPYPSLLNTYGFVLLALLLFREAGIPYLAMRLWMTLWCLLLVWSIAKFLFRFQRDYGARVDQRHKAEQMKRYLPRKKK